MSDRLEEIKRNYSDDAIGMTSDDLEWLVAEVGRLRQINEGHDIYSKSKLKQINSLTKERDGWEDKANAQCIRNDNLQAENLELKQKLGEKK